MIIKYQADSQNKRILPEFLSAKVAKKGSDASSAYNKQSEPYRFSMRMKNQLLLLLATVLTAASAAFAQTPQPIFKVGKAVTPPNESDEIVFEIPDGEVSTYSRKCEQFILNYYGSATQRNDKGGVVRQTYVKEDGTVWLSNPLSCFTMLSYVKAHFDEEGSIVIEGPQFIYDEEDWYSGEWINFYLVPMVLVKDELGTTYVAAEDMKYVLKKTENGYEAEDPTMLLGLATYGELVDNNGEYTGEMGYAWYGYGDRAISYESHPETNGVTPPDSATVEEWVISYNDLTNYDEGADITSVAFDGNDVYIQGLNRAVKDAWVKGTLSDGKVTIPSGTYLGIDELWAYFTYLWGSVIKLEDIYDEEYDETYQDYVGTDTKEVVFTYDADNKMLVLQDGYGITTAEDEYSDDTLMSLYEDVTLHKQNRNINTPPAKPTELNVVPFDDWWGYGTIEFDIPPYDEDGNALRKDRLYYRIFVDNELFTFTPDNYPYLKLAEEGMVNVPFSLYDNDMIFYAGGEYHVVYFNFTLPENCGVQSVYINEEGNELYSEIASTGTVGVDMNVDRKAVSRSFYNMQGQSVPESYVGPVVCKTVFDDGTVKVTKSLKTRK